MHVLTGFLLAGLIGKQSGMTRLAGLKNGPVRIEHVLSGRVRIRVEGLADIPDAENLVQDRLSGIEGVKQVRVTPASGSVLICYREKAIQPELLFAAVVRILGLDDALSRTPRPVVVRELHHVLESLNRVVYDRTNGLLDFTSLAMILLACVGVKKLFSKAPASLPAGATLVWWGINRLLGQGQE